LPEEPIEDTKETNGKSIVAVTARYKKAVPK
jgi:hypothetical protein